MQVLSCRTLPVLGSPLAKGAASTAVESIAAAIRTVTIFMGGLQDKIVELWLQRSHLPPRAGHGLCENAGCSNQEIVMALNPTHLLWLDMEMTGLSPDTDRIIELAIVVTDADLNTVAEGPVLVVHQPDEVMNAMDNWNKGTHGKSGLIDRVKASQLNEAEAEAQMLEFVMQHVPARTSPMCGNSICQDRRFMARYMPQLEAFFHYRNLDVSTLKELDRKSTR